MVMDGESIDTKSGYTASQLFENWTDSFSVYELVTNKDGTEDLRILAANRTFANLISEDWETLPGKLFSKVCTMALDWLPFYIDTAKTGVGNLNESYNYDLKKYLTAITFSPQANHVALMVMDRTNLWEADRALRGREKDLALLFSSMSSGFCIGKIIRNGQGEAVDALFEMVNSSFEILESFSTATLQGKRLFEIRSEDPYFEKYVEVVDNRSRLTFQKYIPENEFTLEVICFSQDDDIFICIENDISSRVKAERELKEAHETIVSSINYASKIQKNLLPSTHIFDEIFQDFSILWKPRDIVGGDIYWVKKFTGGAILCVCDCTGHGTPGALLTMLVVSSFEAIVNEENYRDTGEVMYQLDKRLASVLNASTQERNQRSNLDILDGCDLAVLFIADDGSVSISSGNTNVFVCDGRKVTKYRGQKLYVGEGAIKAAADVKTVMVPPNPDNKFYVASDGLYDQIGGEPACPFGYNAIKKIILESHNESQSTISEKIWEAFETYRGSQARRDDVQLITFKP